MSDTDLLTAALVAEHAAVYGYGVLGGRLDDETRAAARTAFDSHRNRRDLLTAALTERGAEAPVTQAAYDVVVPDRAGALLLAVRLEEGLSQRWRDLLAGTDDVELRRLALAGLNETAVRATQWRVRARVTPATVALPGA
ncbi:MAG: ferritin-like domain-containing protein [Mycobacteriales bacterium]|nr:ferritin-like domain-containing protein [Mycobacteriales bacterium]